MGYRNKFGGTELVDNMFGNLSIGWDYDTNPEKKYPVFLYTPDMKNTNVHYHVPLTKRNAKRLKKWLAEYLKDVK